MTTWIRYLLFQIPGWIIAAIVLIALWRWALLTQWLVVLCFAACVLKDLFLYPFLRTAYETEKRTGSAALIGAKGVAEEDLAPQGYVRVRGELWRAVANPADGTISSGTNVEILGADGMTVFVRAVEAEKIR